MKAVGGTVETQQGTRLTDKGLYAAEQYLPMLGRYRKLAPTAQKDKDRIFSNVSSFFGLPLRTNTQSEQTAATRRLPCRSIATTGTHGRSGT